MDPQRHLEIGSLDDQSSTTLIDDVPSPSVVDGHLLFIRENTLFAQAFDDNGRQLAGDRGRLPRTSNGMRRADTGRRTARPERERSSCSQL